MYENGDGKIVIRTGPQPELGQPDSGRVIATIFDDETFALTEDEKSELWNERYDDDDDGESL